MRILGTFPYPRGTARAEVQSYVSPETQTLSIWLRRIDDGPEVTVAVLRRGGLAFTHNISEADRPVITADFEAFMNAHRT